MASSFEDLLGGIFKEPPKPAPEKGIPWHAKEIDGNLYVPITDVIELLTQNDVLPAVRRGLERHL